MAEKLNVEKAPYGEQEDRQAAAEQAAQDVEEAQVANQEVRGNPEAAAAIEKGSREAQEGAAGTPQGRNVIQIGDFQNPQGIMMAPAVMRQPMRVPMQDQYDAGVLWGVLARSPTSDPLTREMAKRLMGGE